MQSSMSFDKLIWLDSHHQIEREDSSITLKSIHALCSLDSSSPVFFPFVVPFLLCHTDGLIQSVAHPSSVGTSETCPENSVHQQFAPSHGYEGGVPQCGWESPVGLSFPKLRVTWLPPDSAIINKAAVNRCLQSLCTHTFPFIPPEAYLVSAGKLRPSGDWSISSMTP